MNDEFVTRFERCEMAPNEFGHREHVRLAWIYLGRYPLWQALSVFAEGLKRFAAHHGAHGKYHETITWAYMLLIHDRMGKAEHSWERFAETNKDLFDWQATVLKRYYRADTLFSERARRRFVMPDNLGVP